MTVTGAGVSHKLFIISERCSAYAEQTVLVGTFTARPAFGRLVEMARAHVVVVVVVRS